MFLFNRMVKKGHCHKYVLIPILVITMELFIKFMRLILINVNFKFSSLSGEKNRKVSYLKVKFVSLCFPHNRFRNCIISH